MFYSTFGTLGDKEKILRKLEEVAVELESDMEANGWAGRTVTLKYKLATYQGAPFIVRDAIHAITDLL